jgi:hypothetical protein
MRKRLAVKVFNSENPHRYDTREKAAHIIGRYLYRALSNLGRALMNPWGV